MTCDVIIPTFNNPQTLPLTLGALFSQQLPTGWRVKVIISDDGSTDNTATIAHKLCQKNTWDYHIIEGAHTGAAGARNRALSYSKSDIIFFLGADIILKQKTLHTHLRFHSQHPNSSEAALGIVLWDPRIIPTPLMEWMIHGGSQNNYDEVLGSTLVDPKHFFYGSHISLKRQVLEKNRFQEEFQHYGWEDIDLGRRLAQQNGLKLHVLHQAVGHHHHSYSAQQIFSRQRAMGRGFRTFQKHHPQVATPRASHILHKLKYSIIQKTGLLFMVNLIIIALETKRSTPYLYKIAINSHYWCGFHNLFPHKKKTFHTFIHNESTH